jgi:tRNA (guanosine-2'-O-)-methyltransferase
MESVVVKGNDDFKAGKYKDLIVVLEEAFHPKTIENVVRTIHALGIDKLYIVDRRNYITPILEEILARKPIIPSSEPKIRWSFIKLFVSADECLKHLENNKFTSIAVPRNNDEKTNVILQEGHFTQKRLAVWFGHVSDFVIERSEACVSIDMFGDFKNMDLDATIAMVLYEITKQRRINLKNKKT